MSDTNQNAGLPPEYVAKYLSGKTSRYPDELVSAVDPAGPRQDLTTASVFAPVTVGDLASTARGSGARRSGGKPPVHLLPIWAIAHGAGACGRAHPEDTRLALDFLHAIGAIQADRDREEKIGWLLSEFLSNEEWVADAAAVFDYGRKKYSEWNWAKGMPWSVVLGCAVRHLLKIYNGEKNDAESGLSHYGHFWCNVLMLATYVETYPEGNDLPGAALKPSEAAA